MGRIGGDFSKRSERQCMGGVVCDFGEARVAVSRGFAMLPVLLGECAVGRQSQEASEEQQTVSPDIVRAVQPLQDCGFKWRDCGRWRVVGRCSLPPLSPFVCTVDPEDEQEVT